MYMAGDCELWLLNQDCWQIGVQIEPVFDALACRKMRSKATAPSSEAETPRTPSLVARLMGIDGLPESSNNSPSLVAMKKKRASATATAARKKENCSSSSKEEKKKRVIPESVNTSSSHRREPLRSLSCNVAASLPESPRGSTTSARASWDGARMSLQALKENVLAQYMSLPTSPTSANSAKNRKKKRNSQDDTSKERVTAKEIVRQAKEAVANRNKEKQQQQQSFPNNKENVAPPARKDRSLLVHERKHHHQQVVVPSPPQATKRVNPPPPPPPQRAKPSRPPPPPPPITEAPRAAKRPGGCERFATRIKKPAAAAAAAASSSPVTPSAPAAARSPPPRSGSSSRGHVVEDPEYGYLRKVLERGGFLARSGRPFKGLSVVDPIVFHLLELELPAEHEDARLGALRHRWNRKLIFHLAQEILADLLPASSSPPGRIHKSPSPPPGPEELLSRVWDRVRSFPAADCRVVGDIDALVAMDLRSPAAVRRLGHHPAVLEEASDVAEDVADRVLDTLLQECVLVPLSTEHEQESRPLSPRTTG